MPYADLEKARECHAALREILIHHPGGWADRDALHRLEKLAWQAMTAVKDAECQEKMGIVEHYGAADPTPIRPPTDRDISRPS